MPSKLNIFSKGSRSKSSSATDYSRLQYPRGSTESSTPLNESVDLAQEKQKAWEAMRQKQAEEFLAKQGYHQTSSATDGTLPTMESLIILVYGESRKLVQKPANYETLLNVMRGRFPELKYAADDEVAFHFTPEWFDSEVELDRGSFVDVYDRAVLRITTAASAPVRHPGNGIINIEEDGPDVMGPMPPFSGALPPLGWMRVRIVYVPTGQKVCYYMKPCTTMEKLMSKLATDFEFGVDDYSFFVQDGFIEGENTPVSLKMEPNELIEVRLW